MLTRLHVRYTANTFPEDLMFTQTKDKQNFQTRYVIQNPTPDRSQPARQPLRNLTARRCAGAASPMSNAW